MPDDLASARLGVMAALREGDVALAYHLVLGLLGDGYPMPVLVDEVLAPIQWEAGQRWAAGDATISEEHVATAAVETLVALLAGAFDHPAGASTVVVVCAEGDTHTLPARMASALLAYEGHRALFLGSSVPADDLAGYLPSVDASALVVSCTRPAALLGARACVAAGHGAGVPVVVGGRAFGDGPERWQRIGADAHASRLSDLPGLLETWQPDPGAAERRAGDVPPAVTALLEHRAAVADDLVATLAAGGLPGRPLAPAAGDLVDTLAAARFLDDPRLLADQARWVAALLDRHDGVAVTADELLAALGGAAARVSAEVEALVADARRIAADA